MKSKMENIAERRRKMKKEIADLKCKILFIKIKLSELKMVEEEIKKQKKEKSLASLKEKKEKRKEEPLVHTHSKMGFEKNQNDGIGGHFQIPSEEEVQAYLNEKGETRFTAKYFREFYESRDWKSGNEKMANWRSILECWIESENKKTTKQSHKSGSKASQNVVTFNAYKPVETKGAVSYEEYKRMMREGKV